MMKGYIYNIYMEKLGLKKIKESNEVKVLTSTFVTDGAVGEVAALGDGNAGFRFDAGALGHVREEDGAEAARVLAELLHLKAAAAGNRRFSILRRGGTRQQLYGFVVWS